MLVLRILLAALARPSRRLRYGREHRDQRAEVWLPRGGGRQPVCVLLHGGWWQARRTRTLLYMRPLARDLARRGWVVVNAEYRRIGDGGGWPMTFDDVGAAIAAAAGLPEADPERLTVIGHSAGGQLALWSARRPGDHVRPARVVALSAPSDLEATADAMVPRLLGGTAAEVPERYAAANPIRLLPLGAEILLVHGAGDTTVSPVRSRDFALAARAAGDDVTLVETGGGHREPIDPAGRGWAAVVSWLERR